MTAALQNTRARAAATQSTGARAAAAPGANWAGWAGYTPTVRGPAERRARAAAAGLVGSGTLNVDVLEAVVQPPPRQPSRSSRGSMALRSSAILRRGERCGRPMSRV